MRAPELKQEERLNRAEPQPVPLILLQWSARIHYFTTFATGNVVEYTHTLKVEFHTCRKEAQKDATKDAIHWLDKCIKADNKIMQ